MFKENWERRNKANRHQSWLMDTLSLSLSIFLNRSFLSPSTATEMKRFLQSNIFQWLYPPPTTRMWGGKREVELCEKCDACHEKWRCKLENIIREEWRFVDHLTPTLYLLLYGCLWRVNSNKWTKWWKRRKRQRRKLRHCLHVSLDKNITTLSKLYFGDLRPTSIIYTDNKSDRLFSTHLHIEENKKVEDSSRLINHCLGSFSCQSLKRLSPLIRLARKRRGHEKEDPRNWLSFISSLRRKKSFNLLSSLQWLCHIRPAQVSCSSGLSSFSLSLSLSFHFINPQHRDPEKIENSQE